MFISPIILGNIGITPYNVDCIGINITAATDFEVGDLVLLDLRQSLADDGLIPGDETSGWSCFDTPVVNAAQRPELCGYYAIYLGRAENTAQARTLSAGEKGRFRLHGMVDAWVNNPDATDAPAGRPIALTNDGTLPRTLDVQGGAGFRLQHGRKVLGVNAEAVATTATRTLTRVYFNGFGMATYDNITPIATIASAATVETLIDELTTAGIILAQT